MIRAPRDLNPSIVSPFLTLALVLLVASAAGAAPSAKPFVRQALQELEHAVGSPFEATVSPTTGLVTFLSFAPGQELAVLPETAPAEERAWAFLDRYGAAFGVLGRDWASLTRAAGPDEVGMEHVRFRQTHRGVPVTGGELIVHLRGSAVVAVNGKTLSHLDHVETIPIVDALASAEAARQLLFRRLGVETRVLTS